MSSYPAKRVKGRDIRDGDLYTSHPLGKIARAGDRGTWSVRPRREGGDVLRFDYEPEDRSLFRELEAWLVHAGTGRPLDRKRYNGHNVELVLRPEGGVGGSLAIAVRLHQTDVVTVNVDDYATLRTGGWATMLTSRVIETFLPERWQIEKHGSELPWILWTTAEQRCGRCSDYLHDEPAPDGTSCWVDTTGGDVCHEDSYSLMVREPNPHYPRAAHDLAFREGMIVDLRSGRLVLDRDERGGFLPLVKSPPKDESHGASWQSRAWGPPRYSLTTPASALAGR